MLKIHVLSEPAFSTTKLSASLHNTLVFILCVITAWWLSTLIVKLLILRLKVEKQLRLQGAFHLDGAGSFRRDFRLMFRTHFNQIIRHQRIIPPVAVPRIEIPISIYSDSFEIKVKSQEVNRPHIKFKFDAKKPAVIQFFSRVKKETFKKILESYENSESVSVRLENLDTNQPRRRNRIFGFFGSSNNQSRRLLYPERPDCPARDENPISQIMQNSGWISREYQVDAGMGQCFTLDGGDLEAFRDHVAAAPAHRNHSSIISSTVGSKLMESDLDNVATDEEVDLVIIASNQNVLNSGSVSNLGSVVTYQARAEISAAKLNVENKSLNGKIVKQIIICYETNPPQEPVELFGFGNEDTQECSICMVNLKDTVLLPCRHCSSCFGCLRALRQEKCPICRSVFTGFVTFPLRNDLENSSENDENGTGSSSNSQRAS